VGSTGIVSGLASGTVNISYTKTGCASVVPVTVNAITIGSITGTTTTCTGATTTLSSTTYGATWSSANTSVATISSGGVVSGVAAGTSVITYLSALGCYRTATVTVHTPPTAVTGTNSICTSTPVTLTDGTSGGSWTSSNTAKATVVSTGVVTGHAAGTATISYSISGCAAATFPITVSICRDGEAENSVSTNSDAVNAYSIYPNPTSGLLNIVQSVPNDIISDIRVLNYLGQIVYEGNLVFSQGAAHLYLDNIMPGMYLVVISDAKDQSATFRVVVEK
jgi:hypothetical protein